MSIVQQLMHLKTDLNNKIFCLEQEVCIICTLPDNISFITPNVIHSKGQE